MTPTHFSSSNHLRLIDAYYHAYRALLKANLDYGHGFFNAQQEALYALCHYAEIAIDMYPDFANANLETSRFNALMRCIHTRIHTQKPIAYLTKHAHFHGLDIYVDERALVPRSFIGELLTNEESLLHTNHPTRILDLCTGSGCLAILAAHIWQNVHVDALDLCPKALEVAIINQKRFKNFPIHLIHADATQYQSHEPYDLILCNPPYVNDASMRTLPKSYRHEPAHALAGGEDGMDIIRRIIQNAAHHLSADGMLVIEIGNEYEYAMAAFGHLEPVWLEVSAGDTQVMMFYGEQLQVNNTND